MDIEINTALFQWLCGVFIGNIVVVLLVVPQFPTEWGVNILLMELLGELFAVVSK